MWRHTGRRSGSRNVGGKQYSHVPPPPPPTRAVPTSPKVVIFLRLQGEEDHLGLDNLGLIRDSLRRESLMGWVVSSLKCSIYSPLAVFVMVVLLTSPFYGPHIWASKKDSISLCSWTNWLTRLSCAILNNPVMHMFLLWLTRRIPFTVMLFMNFFCVCVKDSCLKTAHLRIILSAFIWCRQRNSGATSKQRDDQIHPVLIRVCLHIVPSLTATLFVNVKYHFQCCYFYFFLFNIMFPYREGRYLLIMTENFAALPRIKQLLLELDKEEPYVIFGSSFPKDQLFTQARVNFILLRKVQGVQSLFFRTFSYFFEPIPIFSYF